MYPTLFPYLIQKMTVPSWAVERPEPWVYAGWIANPPAVSTFDELLAQATKSSQFTVREADLYPQGAAIWERRRVSER